MPRLKLLPEDFIETLSTESSDGWTPELRAAKRRVMEWAKKNPDRDPLMGFLADAAKGLNAAP